VNQEILKTIENLPEQLELTESEWYEYHYYFKRNLFLVRKILNLPRRPRKLYVTEPRETYIGTILQALGFHVHYNDTYKAQPHDFMVHSFKQGRTFNNERKQYDLILLLNIIERHQGHPVTFLKRQLSLLKDRGRIILITENVGQFKNRAKLLLGRTVFAPIAEADLPFYKPYVLSDLVDILSHADLKILDSFFISPYPPFKIEALTLKGYLLKYLNYFVMKAVPGCRDTIFLEAERAKSLS